MAVFKAYFWKSLALFTRSSVPFSKTEAESQLTLSTWHQRWVMLHYLNATVSFCFSHSEVKLTVASFLSDRIVDEILDALSHCHHRLVSAVHIRSGTPSAVCRDAGQAPGWGCRFFPASYSFATLWPRSYFSSPTLLPDNSRIC